MPTETPAAGAHRPRPLRAGRGPGAMLDRDITRILRSAGEPLGAYAIAARLREGGRTIVIMSVYRSLDRLCLRNSVEKIETTARFRIKDAPRAILIVCAECGATASLPIPRHHAAVEHAVAETGFSVQRMVFEAVGLCIRCRRLRAG